MTIQDLKDQNLILFEVISGSKAFGLDTPSSDTDIKGVFYLPKKKFYGLQYLPQISNETNDIVYYEIGRFIELLLKNNPNILEILATPNDCILYKNPIFNKIQIKDFLSKICKDSFAGYAITQIKKARGLNKKIVNPMPKEMKSILDFCTIVASHHAMNLKDWLQKNAYKQENCGLVKIPNTKDLYGLYYDTNDVLKYKGIQNKTNSNEVSLSSVPQTEDLVVYLIFNQDNYSRYAKEYNEYWSWVEKRNPDRFETNQKHGKNYDSKNMMHTIRLLQTANNIFKTNSLNIRVTNRDFLLNIKSGAIEYDEIIALAEDLIKQIETNFLDSSLPNEPNYEFGVNLLYEIRQSVYSI